MREIAVVVVFDGGKGWVALAIPEPIDACGASTGSASPRAESRGEGHVWSHWRLPEAAALDEIPEMHGGSKVEAAARVEARLEALGGEVVYEGMGED